jgi:hypothetical protein
VLGLGTRGDLLIYRCRYQHSDSVQYAVQLISRRLVLKNLRDRDFFEHPYNLTYARRVGGTYVIRGVPCIVQRCGSPLMLVNIGV